MNLLRSIGLAALITLSSSVFALPMYSLVELPTAGSYFVTPMAINNSGIVVGNGPSQSHGGQVFLSNGITVTLIETILGTVRDVNNLGQIVGSGFGGATGATLYDGGVITELPTLGGPLSEGIGINDLGWIVGVGQNSLQKYQSFIIKNGLISQLENLTPNRYDATSNAKAINNNGVVVGHSTGTADNSLAVMWDSSGTIHPLGTLGGPSSTAEAVNDAGQIVGYADYSLFKHGAFIWQNGVMTDLGNLGGPGGAAATSINSAGHVVGAASATAGLGGGFIWTASDGMVALDTLLDPAFSSWQILQGQGINDSDQIVAYARASENSPWTIVILTPIVTEAVPVPATAALLSIGLLGFLVSTRQPKRDRPRH